MLHGAFATNFVFWHGEGDDVRDLWINVQFKSMLTSIGEL